MSPWLSSVECTITLVVTIAQRTKNLIWLDIDMVLVQRFVCVASNSDCSTDYIVEYNGYLCFFYDSFAVANAFLVLVPLPHFQATNE
jgi:hypothetical protein